MTDSLRSPIYVADLGAAGHVMVTGPRVRSQLKAWGLPALWLAAEHGLRSVSYTHLDVYKRQAHKLHKPSSSVHEISNSKPSVQTHTSIGIDWGNRNWHCCQMPEAILSMVEFDCVEVT